MHRKFLLYFFSLLLISVIFHYGCSSKTQPTATIGSDQADTVNIPIEPKPTIQYRDKVYDAKIKTVLFRKIGLDLSDPILTLNSTSQLELKFDDLVTDAENYSYSIIHCNADWQPSSLTEYDYIDGFIDNRISEFEFSYNTTQQYVHYSLRFPTQDYSITKSGNYLLIVYQNSKADPIITRRFYVVDQQVKVSEHVKQPFIAEYRRSHQEIDFDVDFRGLNITNPYQDIKVVITQNDRWDNQIENLKPTFIRDNKLIYDFQRENLFAGGKEFRNFRFSSLRYLSERLRHIDQNVLADDVYIIDDQVRAYQNYIYIKDINGRYIIEVQEGNNDDLEADYANIHFTLPFNSMLTTGKLYIVGSMTDWDIKEDFEMKFNFKTLTYENSVLLKQGYYEYIYVFVGEGPLPNQEGLRGFDETLIEGSYYGTENDYKIYVYYRPITERYDQLIGIKSFNTLETFR